MQDPKDLGHPPLLSQAAGRELDGEVEQPDMNQVPIWDAIACRWMITFCMSTLPSAAPLTSLGACHVSATHGSSEPLGPGQEGGSLPEGEAGRPDSEVAGILTGYFGSWKSNPWTLSPPPPATSSGRLLSAGGMSEDRPLPRIRDTQPFQEIGSFLLLWTQDKTQHIHTREFLSFKADKLFYKT